MTISTSSEDKKNIYVAGSISIMDRKDLQSDLFWKSLMVKLYRSFTKKSLHPSLKVAEKKSLIFVCLSLLSVD